MQKRKMGCTDLEVSLLGFGCMRLPTLADSQINQPEAIRLIRHAIDHGVNYLDTAYGYHNGESEALVGKVLKNGYREKVFVATKLPTWLLNSKDDCARLFEEQLRRLDVSDVDFYLLHALNSELWQRSLKYGALEFIEQAKAQGKLRYLGFSFHDDFSVFKEIVDAYPWDFCQIQFNYMDEHYQAGLEGLKYAAGKQMGVIVMEPLRGGRLVRNLPPEIAELFGAAKQQRSPADWALSWVANHPEVSLILSGMNKYSDVEENLSILKDARPNSLGKGELELIKKAQQIYAGRVRVLCTDCGYCQPCPQTVAIPRIFSMYNNVSVYGAEPRDRQLYSGLVAEGHGAESCIACGQCEEVCPQRLPIIESLKLAQRALS